MLKSFCCRNQGTLTLKEGEVSVRWNEKNPSLSWYSWFLTSKVLKVPLLVAQSVERTALRSFREVLRNCLMWVRFPAAAWGCRKKILEAPSMKQTKKKKFCHLFLLTKHSSSPGSGWTISGPGFRRRGVTPDPERKIGQDHSFNSRDLTKHQPGLIPLLDY